MFRTTTGCPMPTSTRTEVSGPSNVSKSSKRTMSDAEPAPQDPKKPRRNTSPEPTARRDPSRDTRRRKRRKKKAPVVSPGPDKNDAQREERARPPSSTRNEIIRFTSDPPEGSRGVPVPKAISQAPSPKLLGKGRESCSHTLGPITEHRSQDISTLRDDQHAVPADAPVPEASTSSLGDKVVQLEAELRSKDNLIASHQALLNQVQQAVTCQVCLDLMYKPYALAPCGHLACHSCLVNWFTAPPPDNQPMPPAIMRKKTCPHCRAVVRERPVEVWGVKGIARAVGKCGLLPNQLPVPVQGPAEGLDADADPWKDIFPKPGTPDHRGFPWFFPGADIDDDDINIVDIAPRGEDIGMLDMEDGGIYRCLDCMHEIWGGVCSSCGRVYPGHRPEEDDEDEDGDPMGWLEDQMGAEEVDVGEDPGWMGLEEGEGDDAGDSDDWPPFPPWRRPLHVYRGPWGFLGTLHVHEDEEDIEVDGRVDHLRVHGEDEESEDEGYESSFIDDDDEGDTGVPRIYEIGDGDDYGPNRRSRSVDSVEESERGRVGRRQAVIVVSSDEEGDEREEEVVRWRSTGRGRVRGVVELDEH